MVTIEDAPELHLPHPNTVALVAERPNGSERSPALLLESALRMRSDRLIFGEIRRVGTLNFLEAINTAIRGPSARSMPAVRSWLWNVWR